MRELNYLQAQNQLKTFAAMTGGLSFSPLFQGELPDDFAQINNSIRNQYVLTYRPTNTKNDGSYRKIKVLLVDNEGHPLQMQDEKGKPLKYSVIARDGYNAKRCRRVAVRIASLQPSITLTLAALNRLDALCAITKYCLEALPELAARNLPILHDSWSVEHRTEILAAQPDLVIASVPYRMESLAAILKSGLPVLALAPHSLADIYADTRLIAAHVHADPEPLIARMQSTIAATRARTEHIRRNARSSTAKSGANRSSTRSTGSPNWSKPPAHASSARPARTPRPKRSPPPIPTSSSSPGAAPATASRSTASSPSATGTTSAPSATRRVHCIPDEYLNTPAPTLLEGLACIAAAAHPTLHPPHPRLITLAATAEEVAQPS